MPSGLTITFTDWNNENASTSFRGQDVTSANYDAQITLADALIVAVDAVSIAANTGNSFRSRDIKTGAPKPTNNFAQRELKWLVSFVDNSTGATSNIEIPGADLSLLSSGNELDLGAGPGADLKSAIEAFHLSNAGNAVSVLSVRKVGRNL